MYISGCGENRTHVRIDCVCVCVCVCVLLLYECSFSSLRVFNMPPPTHHPQITALVRSLANT